MIPPNSKLKKVLASLLAVDAVGSFHFQSVMAGSSKPKPEPSTPIKHVVITMLENRSFDNIAGYFDYSPEIDGLLNQQKCYPADTRKPDSELFCPTNNAPLYNPDGPYHGLTDVSHQIFGTPTPDNATSPTLPSPPPMSGFVSQHIQSWNDSNPTRVRRLVDGFKTSDVPVTYTLAKEFALFDRWFCSFPGSTQPNRLFLHTATSGGEVETNGKNYVKGYGMKSIWTALSENGLNWADYWMEIPSLLVLQDTRAPQHWGKYKHFKHFLRDAKKGQLPAVSFVDMIYGNFDWTIPYANDGHAPGDFRRAEMFLKEMYETLRKSPQWDSLLWIITYDEHGGFADHVPTPMNGIPNPDGILGKNGNDFPYDRLGPRVPTIMVSPWIKKGTVVHEPTDGPFPTSQYDHTSIAATLSKLFNLKIQSSSSNSGRHLTKRDEWAGTFDWLFKELPQPRSDCPETMPDPVPLDAPQQGQGNETMSEKRHRETRVLDLSLRLDEQFRIPEADLLGLGVGTGKVATGGINWEDEKYAIWKVFKEEILERMTEEERREFIEKNM
ncbi:hypothetical protein HK102_007441 [Quaeritorhiza haematococci]|nr:hypothetical protein HK102_007441 [Quaeritorhiza haematococci]